MSKKELKEQICELIEERDFLARENRNLAKYLAEVVRLSNDEISSIALGCRK